MNDQDEETVEEFGGGLVIMLGGILLCSVAFIAYWKWIA